ncbi:LuxR C-terminal-related transcriptional regulator [Thiomicrorhabdus sp.]|uniref:LuxR C-terminal-related transcriptional regulator n=1 Tax=Thiomicrorhabdus sp. TaxID=2039724 RepID=UPI0029C6124F|nr:LuxR C-terminal-related transcriptional regulator [Thiomicrorhabdus sp.]
MISKGLSNKLIARELGISDGTVKVYVKNLLRKLGTALQTGTCRLEPHPSVTAPRMIARWAAGGQKSATGCKVSRP